MDLFMNAIKEAEAFYWKSMEVIESGDVHRVRCRHCHMVKDIEGDQNPRDTFTEVEHHMRACALVHAATQVRQALH